MTATPRMLPLSGIRVIWCDAGATPAEIHPDMSDVNVEPTVTTYDVESGSAVDMTPVAVGYQVTCREGYTSDLLIAIDADSEDGTIVVLDLGSGVNWVIPAHLADDVTAGARATITPGQLILTELMFRQRRGRVAYVGTFAEALGGNIDTGAVPAGSRVHGIVTAAGTVGGTQRAAGLHDLGTNRVQGASTASGYLTVGRAAEVED